MFLLETYVNNVVGSVEETVRMFAQVDHPGLGLLMDPTNYFETPQHRRDGQGAQPGLRHAGRQDQDRPCQGCRSARATTSREKHADIGDADALASHTFRGVGEIVLHAPGPGALNYDLYLKRLAEKHPNIPVIIEHLAEDDVPRAKKFLDGKFRANGLVKADSAGRSTDSSRDDAASD